MNDSQTQGATGTHRAPFIRSQGMFIGLLLLLSVIAFWRVPTLGFDSDDEDYLKHAAACVADPSRLLSPAQAFPFGRPTTELFFVLAYAIWQDSAQHYHVGLIALHMLASVLLYHTLRRMGLANRLCFLSSVLFLVNPSHFQAVHWISCTAYAPSLIFGLIALIGFLSYIDTARKRSLIISAFALEKVLAIRPQNPTALYALGSVRTALGDFDLAIEALKQAIQQAPDNLGAYEKLGDVYMIQSRLEEAAKIYQKALFKSPAHSSISNKLARIQRQKAQQE